MMAGKRPARSLRYGPPSGRVGYGREAGVEPLRSAAVLPPPRSRGVTRCPPLPLRSSTPASLPPPCGGRGADNFSIVEKFSCSSLPSAWCCRPLASSLVLQQMIYIRPRSLAKIRGNQPRAAPRGHTNVPSGLRRAVKSQAALLHFVAPFQVTARRPAGPTARPRGLRLSQTP